MEQAAALWQKCFRGTSAPPSKLVEQHFREVFLDSPWYDPELAPLVLDVHGELVGFIGRIARPMVFRGQRVRCAVATQLMVDPERKLAFGAIELVRALHAGPQDLCYSDGANEHSLRVWQRCGGQASRLLSFEWTRRLRPVQCLSLRLKGHRRLAPVGRVMHAASPCVDAAVGLLMPRFYHRPDGQLQRQDATAVQILPILLEVSASAPLHAYYCAQSFSWLTRKAAESRSLGELRTVLVNDSTGQAVGWFLYYTNPGKVAQVLQVGATYGNRLAVLSELFADAWEHGAAAVSGQLDPLLMTELSNSYCEFRCPDLGVLVHSRNPDILNAIQRGEAFMSRLDGEWWIRLGIDRRYDW